MTFRYGVSGYPTLKFFPKGNKAGEDYDGGRELDDFVKFINEKCGTSRDTKGQLTSEVGWMHIKLLCMGELMQKTTCSDYTLFIVVVGGAHSKFGCPRKGVPWCCQWQAEGNPLQYGRGGCEAQWFCCKVNSSLSCIYYFCNDVICTCKLNLGIYIFKSGMERSTLPLQRKSWTKVTTIPRRKQRGLNACWRRWETVIANPNFTITCHLT